MKRIPRVDIREEFIPFEGGLDLVSPPLQVKPGFVRESQNVYQDINEGYKWGVPYEAFDGSPSPSDASFTVVYMTFTGTVSVYDTVEEEQQQVLADDTEVVADDTVVIADAGGGTTASGTVIAVTSEYIVVSKVTGAFVGGSITVAGNPVGTSTSVSIGSGPTASLTAQYANLAADLYRADIAEVPGSGSVLGVWYYDGTWYAARNNSAGTAAVLHKETSTGWAEVDLGYELSFTSGGTYEISEGDTITGATGGATAEVTRVILESGTFAAGTAAGRLIFSSQTGTFEAENLDVGAELNVATIAADSSAITLLPSGRFEFVNANFTGSSTTFRMYGVDGVNRAFEFDGTVFAPIDTGMASDTPEHIYYHKKHLFLSFGDQIQHSSPGFPYLYAELLTGTDQIGMGEDITGFMAQPGTSSGGALAIFTRNAIGVLYGNNTDDFVLVHYKKEVGAIEWSIQYFGDTYMLDDRGITNLRTSEVYGNFEDATVSKLVQPFLKTRRAKVTASCVVRDLNQYWIFFNDDSAVCCTMEQGKVSAIMPMLFEHDVTCICSTEDSAGDESIMFGSSDGYVYQLFKGTSMNGEDITWYMDLAWIFSRSPFTSKNFRQAMLEIVGDGYSSFDFSYSLQYSDTGVQQSTVESREVGLGEAAWDSGASWDSGVTWDITNLKPEYFAMLGTGRNISLRLGGKCDYCTPLRFSGAIIQYNPTRVKR